MTPQPPNRLNWIDDARAIALIAMTMFHFTWDLSFFGLIDDDLVERPGFHLFGHAIAIGFLTLAGIGMTLHFQRPAPWPGYWRRLILLCLSALVVTLSSFQFSPDSPILFGILHCLALSSLVALLFLPVGTLPILLAALILFLLPVWGSCSTFDTPWLNWVGLSTQLPDAEDYRPFLPWVAFVLMGMAAGRHLPAVLRQSRGKRRGPLAFLGRHSLLYYLLHQPILILLLSLYVAIHPHDAPDHFTSACISKCKMHGGLPTVCEQTCLCVAGKLKGSGSATQNSSATVAATQSADQQDVTRQCLESEDVM